VIFFQKEWMKQLSLAETGFLPKAGKRTRKEKFLEEMESVVPWGSLEALIEPHYPKKGKERLPMALSSMPRIHFMQQWFGYSDPAKSRAPIAISSNNARRMVAHPQRQTDTGLAIESRQSPMAQLLEKIRSAIHISLNRAPVAVLCLTHCPN
jgi:hypothetical protein